MKSPLRWSLPLILLAPLVALGAPEPPTRPNVVVLLADDAGWGDYGHSGNNLARTPHIDSIARDGDPRGGLRRSSGAPNCAYFVHWTGLQDRAVWSIDVHTAGRYEVTADYTCPLDDAGPTIELSFLDARLVGTVAPGWDPPLHTNQDTLPRPQAESQMKDFHTLKLGVANLREGHGTLTLRALKIPGQSVMDLRRLTLTLLD